MGKRIWLWGTLGEIDTNNFFNGNANIKIAITGNKADVVINETFNDTTGNVKLLSVKLAGKIRVKDDGDTYTFDRSVITVASPKISVTLLLPLGGGATGYNFRSIDIDGALQGPDNGDFGFIDKLGLVFKLNDTLTWLHTAIKANLSKSAQDAITLNPGQFKSLAVSFNLASKQLCFLPSSNAAALKYATASVLDSVGTLGTMISHKQTFNLVQISFDGANYKYEFNPVNGVFFSGPEILSTDSKTQKGNDIVFQYAFVNGFLALTTKKVNVASGTFETGLSWNKSAVTGFYSEDIYPAAVVLTRWKDQTGNPAIICAGNNTVQFTLDYRKGTTAFFDHAQAQAANKDSLEVTNSSLCMVDESLTGLRIGLIDTLLLIGNNPTSFFEKRNLQLYKLAHGVSRTDAFKDTTVLSAPFWVKPGKGVPVLAGKVPTELIGLSKGLRLSRDAGSNDGTLELVSKKTDKVLNGTNHTIFYKTEMVLNATNWHILNQFSEVDYPDKDSNKPNERKFTSNHPTLSLPIIDTSYAAANTVGSIGHIKHADGDLHKSLSEWVSGLDSQLSNSYKFKGKNDEKHVTGFIRQKPEAEHLANFLTLPPAKAENSVHTAHKLPQLLKIKRPNTEALVAKSESLLADAKTLVADLEIETGNYFFGGVKSDVATFIKEKTELYNAAARTLNSEFLAVKNIWDALKGNRTDDVSLFLKALWNYADGAYDLSVIDRLVKLQRIDLRPLAQNFLPLNEIEKLQEIFDDINQLADKTIEKNEQLLSVIYAAVYIIKNNKNLSAKTAQALWNREVIALKSIFNEVLHQTTGGATQFKIPEPYREGVTNFLLSADPEKDLEPLATLLIQYYMPSAGREFYNRWQVLLKNIYAAIDIAADYQKLFTTVLNVPDFVAKDMAIGLTQAPTKIKTALELLVASHNAISEVKNIQSLFAEIPQGASPVFVALQQCWQVGDYKILYKAYGNQLTEAIYNRFLNDYATGFATLAKTEQALALQMRQASTKLLEQLNAQIKSLDWGELQDLSEISTEPPAYVLFSKKLKIKYDKAFEARIKTTIDNLLGQKLDLCRFGGGVAWDLLLSEDTVVIVKLSKDRTMDDILREIEENYRKENKVEFPLGKPHKKISETLHTELLNRDTQCILILNPTADISGDSLLSAMAGRNYFKMVYAAIMGDAPPGADSNFNVYARINQQDNPAPTEDQKKTEKDVHLSLTKFDVVIKNTQIESGDIQFNLDIYNSLGRSQAQMPVTIKIQAVIPERKAQQGPVSIEFKAWLPNPKEIKIDLGFLDKLEIAQIVAKRANGQNTLEIDGALYLQNFNSSLNLSSLTEKIDLKEFRINIPDLPAGMNLKMGVPRLLNFEFPSVVFKLNGVRSLNLAGIELDPVAIGVMRKVDDVTKRLADAMAYKYMWLGGGNPLTGADFNVFTFLEIKVDFGNLPRLGNSGLKKLNLEGIIGLRITKEGKVIPCFGLSKIRGEQIVIDIFSLLTLEIDSIELAEYTTPTNKTLSVFSIDNARLKVLNYSLIDSLSAYMIQQHPNGDKNVQQKGFLALYNSDGAEPGTYFKLYSALVASNLQMDNQFLHFFMNPAGAANPLKAVPILDRAHHTTTFDLTHEKSWLFGVSFSFLEVFDRCSVVFQEGHYYGIHLATHNPLLIKAFGEMLTLAYMPGKTKQDDRFRIELPLKFLEFISSLRGGLFAFEISARMGFLFDVGFPWKIGNGHAWVRTPSLYTGVYETSIGFFFGKESTADSIIIRAGIAVKFGYGISIGNQYVWLRAGIGIFCIMEGLLEVKTNLAGISKPVNMIKHIQVRVAIGIFAYAEGGIDIWIISARFRVELEAALAGVLDYTPETGGIMLFEQTFRVHYSASASIKLGFTRITFSVSGDMGYTVAGQLKF